MLFKNFSLNRLIPIICFLAFSVDNIALADAVLTDPIRGLYILLINSCKNNPLNNIFILLTICIVTYLGYHKSFIILLGSSVISIISVFLINLFF